MKEIACYIRSSSNSEDQQRALEQQEFLLKSYYKDRDIIFYSDVGTGTGFKRSGFQKLMYDAGLNLTKLNDGRITFEADKWRKPIFEEIAVINASRFSRNVSIIEVLRVLWDYKKINVHFMDIMKNSNNPNDVPMLNMFFAMAENEVIETSKRTIRGNKTSVMQNKIRNGSIFGFDFDRENNRLIKNEEESKVVELIYKICLSNGLKKTAQIINELGYKTKKGNLWTDSTIKTLIINPKYKGFNVRNKFESINLFTDSKVKYIKKENWVIQRSENIEAIVSEELWEGVQKALENRCLNGNRGINANIYDTKGKIICKKCGSSYCRAVERRLSDKLKENLHYLICMKKKRFTKKVCDAENINMGILDKYIEKQCLNYYKRLRFMIDMKITKLKDDIEKIKLINENDINKKLIKYREFAGNLNNNIEISISKHLDESMFLELAKQNESKEIKAKEFKMEIDEWKLVLANKKDYIRNINKRIEMLEKEKSALCNDVIERKEWLEKVEYIVIGGKSDLKTIYKY
ncbi:MAG: recombinase family protein [Sarcina sp.]